jgi:drug/metabolite transporter (DMT)-like permease
MTSVTPGQRRQALLMLIFANSFWGLSFPLIKSLALIHERLVPGSSNWFITAWALAPRFLISTVLMLAWQGKSLATATRSEWKQGVGLALFAAGGMIFQTDGLQFTAASTSAFLTQFYAIMIPVYLAVRARKTPPWTVWISSVLVLAGVAILGRFDWSALSFGRGEFETLISSVFFMGQILWLERKEFAPNRVLTVTLIMFGTESIVFTALGAGTAQRVVDLLIPWQSSEWLILSLIMAVVCTMGALLVMNTYQPKITATEAGLIYCVEPIFGSLFALFLPAMISTWAAISYPNEVFTTSLVLGGGLITAANILIQLKPLPKEV